MHIGRRRFALNFVLAALLLLPYSASAQTGNAPTNDWSALNTVSPGSSLFVKLKNGNSIEGKLSGVSDTALSLSVKKKPIDVKREDVFSVHQTGKRSGAKATLIGLGLGAGAGALVGTVAGSKDDGFEKIDRAATAGLTVIGGAAGALVGYLVGKSGRKRVLIYKAK